MNNQIDYRMKESELITYITSFNYSRNFWNEVRKVSQQRVKQMSKEEYDLTELLSKFCKAIKTEDSNLSRCNKKLFIAVVAKIYGQRIPYGFGISISEILHISTPTTSRLTSEAKLHYEVYQSFRQDVDRIFNYIKLL